LHSISVSWQDSWLNGGLAWFPGPFALESVSLWRLWGSLLSASDGEISGADWLAAGGNPLITGWKLVQSNWLGWDRTLTILNWVSQWGDAFDSGNTVGIITEWKSLQSFLMKGSLFAVDTWCSVGTVAGWEFIFIITVAVSIFLVVMVVSFVMVFVVTMGMSMCMSMSMSKGI